MKTEYKVAIIGGGTAGITAAAQLAKKIFPGEIVIIDPADVHYYQPIWTLVGAGLVKKEDSVRQEKNLIPRGVSHVQEAVKAIDPDGMTVTTESETKIKYQYLIVCPGLQLNWNKVKGLEEAIGKDGVVSNYAYEYVDKTWEALRNFKGGNAIFTHPNTPIKCGGAPQKIMYLAEEFIDMNNLKDNTNVMFYSADPSIFGVEKYKKLLERIVEERGIQTHFRRNLIEIRGGEKEAVFENLETGETETVPYEMIHVTPPMGPHDFMIGSPVSDETGWVDVDPYTLQHKTYSTVFGLGDAANLPTSKTGAAIRKEVPVAVSNILSLMKGEEMKAKYDGYTSCPIITGKGKLILAEFDYEKQPKETFPFDQAKERYSMYLLKKELLPRFYWHGMLKGRM